MTQDEIIRMAREAGVIGGFDDVHPSIERLAALAFAAGATHERAKELTGANISLYKLAEDAGFDVAKWAINGGIEVIVYEEGPITGELTRFAALVAAHEREACADLCSRMGVGSLTSGIDLGPWDCAEQIKARGESRGNDD